MRLDRRNVWFLAIALGVIILITLLAAPKNSNISSGSTYSRAPNGYGAWYAFMQKQEIPIKRWQKPLEEFPGIKSKESNNKPMTLLRINSDFSESWLNYLEQQWIEKGNILVILGVKQPVTEANFTTLQESAFGQIKIDTTRRRQAVENETKRLGDSFGTIVWSEELGKGEIIYASTPYLGANAYQDEPGNFKFLAELVSEGSSSIWVNEYIHGYKDKEVTVKEGNENWIDYLVKTPLFPAFLQVGVILVILVLANLRRFGQPITIPIISVNNSQAYIQALASVLQKAESREFVLDTIGKEEQLQLQKALGLGDTPVDNETLVNVWAEQTGRKPAELQQLLKNSSKKRRLSTQELLSWLKKWQTIHPSSSRR